MSFRDLPAENVRVLHDAFAEDKEGEFDVPASAISSSLAVLVAWGPSSKVIAIYGPSTLTSVNVIFSVLEGFSVGEVAANPESCAAAAA
jgi:hypothetical protein